MRQLTFIIALCLTILSCSSNTGKEVNNKLAIKEQQKAKLEALNLDFQEPVLLDSSVYVMYPLPLETVIREKRDYSGSSSYSSSNYWNIVFYNTASGDYHLLNKNRKMVIFSYNEPDFKQGEAYSTYVDGGIGRGYSQVMDLLFYSVTTLDYNQDGKLNSDDPRYLFISDKNGRKFKQVSPEKLDVTDWKIVKETNKILFKVTKDSNNDKEFNEKDESIPMVYDLSKNGFSQEIFNSNFKLELKKQLSDQWSKKD